MKTFVAEYALGLGALLVGALVLLGYGGYRYEVLRIVLAQTQTGFASTTEALRLAREENHKLAEAFYAEQQKNLSFEEQINGIASTVGTLEKLKKTDPELLQKYSKVYFLNEHYMPPRLAEIDSDLVLNKERTLQIHANVEDHLEDMVEAAADDEVTLKIVSAFRSFDTQAALKSGYKVTYGAGANKFSADQGYSEHQLGTTVDITTPALPSLSLSFEKTAGYEWLTENAHKYGFVLSYPKGNSYYQFEPWHWRFVGVELARDLHEENKYFYDLDQREINTYLVSIFD